MPDRRYTEEEVGVILSKAVETPELAAGGDGGAEGLSLAQILEIAREVGIDPARVESAALRLDADSDTTTRGWFGIPTTIQFERTIDISVSADDFPDIIAIIRRTLARQGILGDEFGALEWRARDYLGSRYVSVRPRGTRTVIRALGNFRDGAFGSFVAGGLLSGMAGGGILGATGLAAVLGLGSIGVIGAAVLLPPWLFWRSRFEREAEALGMTVERIGAHLTGAAHDTSLTASTSPESLRETRRLPPEAL